MKNGDLAMLVEIMGLQQELHLAQFHAACEHFDRINDLSARIRQDEACHGSATEPDAVIGEPAANHPAAKTIQ